MTEEEFETTKKVIIRFFEGMEKPIYLVNYNGSRSIGEYYKGKDIWFEQGKLNNVLITLDGFQAINQAKFNKSIKLNSRGQTLVLIGTLVVSVIALWIAWLNYSASNDISAQKQYLLPAKELIELLKQKSTIPMSEKPHQAIQRGNSQKSGTVSNSK